MRVVVYGLWHLGCVTASCLAEAGNDVIGLDPDGTLVDRLKSGTPPIGEPGLADLLAAGQRSGRLTFTSNVADALKADGPGVLWVTFDTPVNERDEADVAFVRDKLDAIRDAIPAGTLVLISSQVPVGFTRKLADDWQGRGLRFAVSPENLRLGKALELFKNPDRVVVGLSHPEHDRDVVTRLFAPFRKPGSNDPAPIEWMSLESAEMTKHAVNVFLAISVTYMNELARLCEAVGADAKEVERGLKSENRIGPKAYLAPGGPFAGGTLARDLRMLIDAGNRHNIPTTLLTGTLSSNENHKYWIGHKVTQLLEGAKDPTVAVLGLTYKPGTSTLRRSPAIELCKWLTDRGLRVRGYDPSVSQLPAELRGAVEVVGSAQDALRGADLAVIATEWPSFKTLDAGELVALMRTPCVIDPNWFAARGFANDSRITYVATGRAEMRKAAPAHAAAAGSETQQPPQATDDMPLLGRRAIITGANRGLGLEIARAFIRAGANVVLTARDEALLCTALESLRPLGRDGQEIVAMGGDVADASFCAAAAARLRELPGEEATVLVNNAGVLGPAGLLEENPWPEWSDAVRINLFGTVLMCRAVLPILRAQDYGKVINLSGGGATAPMPRFSAYAASKAAVVRLTETLAHELSGTRIDANAVAPGALNTRMLDDVLRAGPEKAGRAHYERCLKQREQGGAPPEKAAALAVFLASAASDGITGRLISAVWDDWAELPRRREDLAGTDIYTLRRIIPEDRQQKRS